jgi:sulfite reductase (ferredoxin)
MPATTWREQLAGQVDASLTELRKQGKIDEKVFAETRLRRGAYGQRYDNGQRHDGIANAEAPLSAADQRPRHLLGRPGHGADQDPLRRTESRADDRAGGAGRGIFRRHLPHHHPAGYSAALHPHRRHPPMFRRLAAVGITTREACGNSVRNVTACPLAGVCRDRIVRRHPVRQGVAFYLLGHRDTQDFGRKFKIAFSGCEHEACALVSMHDLGGIAKTQNRRWQTVRGFEALRRRRPGRGAASGQAVRRIRPRRRLLPLSRAMGRVFARLGEKKNRNRARLKFLVQKLGIEEFRRLVQEEVATMPADPSWREYFDEIPSNYDEPPGLRRATQRRSPARRASTSGPDQRLPSSARAATTSSPSPARWAISASDQMRALADIAEKYAGGHARTTVEQNIVLRWVPHNKVIDLYNDLKAIGLGRAGAARSSMSPPAPAPTPASSASPPRAAWPANCASAWREKRLARSPSKAICASKSPAASIPAASITSPTSVSTATAETSAATPSAFPGDARRPMDAKTAAATPWPWDRSPASASPIWSPPDRIDSSPSARAKNLSRPSASASARRR